MPTELMMQCVCWFALVCYCVYLELVISNCHVLRVRYPRCCTHAAVSTLLYRTYFVQQHTPAHPRAQQLTAGQRASLVKHTECPDPHASSHEVFVACTGFVFGNGCDIELDVALLDEGLDAAFEQLELWEGRAGGAPLPYYIRRPPPQLIDIS